MYNRHIRHLVTELGNRLSEKEFLKKIGLSRRSMQQLFDKDRWEVIFENAFPARKSWNSAGKIWKSSEMSRKRAGSPSLINM